MSKTIAAVASGVSPAAIGVIRMSGDDALAVAQRCLGNKPLPPRQMCRRILRDAGGCAVDDVLACYFKAPASYTGEDSVEIYAHGGAVNLGRVLSVLCAAGAAPAEPGEFSKRAFLNGKIDLARAEAIMDIIHAQNEVQCREAQKQLSGSVSNAVSALRQSVLDLLCAIEASIDFSSEEELAPLPDARIRAVSRDVRSAIERMRRAHGQYRSAGLRVVLAGAPNAGKSSLFNRLLGRERAIVTDIAGTTTDTIEAQVCIRGEAFLLVDTAGLTDSENPIEALGVERARRQIEEADLIIGFIDGATPDFRPLGELESALAGNIAQSEDCILVRSKADIPDGPAISAQALPDQLARLPIIGISSRSGQGIDALENWLCDRARKRRESSENVALITSQRHMACLDEADDALLRAAQALDARLPAECIAADLHGAARALAQITGAIASEDIVNEIFAHFCIGK